MHTPQGLRELWDRGGGGVIWPAPKGNPCSMFVCCHTYTHTNIEPLCGPDMTLDVYRGRKTTMHQKKPFAVKQGKGRKKNPLKLTQLSSRSHPRHLVERRTAQKDTSIDITSDSQVNSNSHTGGHMLVYHLTTIFTYFYIYI